LAPYRLGVLLYSRLRSHPPASEIADGVWVGRALSLREREARGIRSMIDLAAELPVDSRGVRYRAIPLLDLATPQRGQIEEAVRTIDEFADARPTLVCCALGYSRSATAVATWLYASGRAASLDQAIAVVRAQRPHAALLPKAP
jgi:protein-tyrosine phosphatase